MDTLSSSVPRRKQMYQGRHPSTAARYARLGGRQPGMRLFGRRRRLRAPKRRKLNREHGEEQRGDD